MQNLHHDITCQSLLINVIFFLIFSPSNIYNNHHISIVLYNPQITINGKSTDSIHEHLIERDGLHIYIFISS